MIVTKNGKDAIKIDKLDIEKETQLQEYIHENPESIPVYEIKEDKKLFVVAREFSTESGPIDALAIDRDGDIYVVETKINKNPDKRMVVAQALDYGASLWRHSDYNKFIAKINSKILDKFKISFEDKTKMFFDIDEEQFALLVSSLERNLQDGNIKFVILMDSIEDRLKDLIVYVNQNSQFDIYAVQLEYYKFDEYEIMIPKLFGVEVKKGMAHSSVNQRKVWNEQDFLVQVKEKMGGDAGKITDLYNYLKSKTKIKWGTGNANGSFAPIIRSLSETISPFSIYSDGTFLIKFSWLKNHAEKNIFDQFFNAFVKETLKFKIKITEEDLLKNSFEIKPNDFLNNYEEIVDAIKTTINVK